MPQENSPLVPQDPNGPMTPPPAANLPPISGSTQSGFETELSDSPGIAQYFHAFRRWWLPALTVGIVMSAVAVGAAWTLRVPDYTSRAMLRISARQASLLNSDGQRGNDFEVYKLTHRQLMRGPFVINAALRDPEVAKLKEIREEVDPVAWLQSKLSVSFPDNAEIMEVRLSGEDPDSLATIVNAVVQAYMDEVVDAEANSRRTRLASLERAYSETENDLRSKRSELRRLADTLGTGDTDSLSIVQQNSLQQFALLRSELTKVQFELLRAKGKLTVLEETGLQEQRPPNEDADLDKSQPEQDVITPESTEELEPTLDDSAKRVVDLGVSEFDLENAFAADRFIASVNEEISSIKREITGIEETAAPSIRDRYVPRRQERIAELNQAINDRKREIAIHLTKRQRINASAQLLTQETEIAILEQQQAQLKTDVAGFEKEAKQFGRSSVDVEMMRTEIRSLEEMLARIGREIESTKIELKSDSRVTFFQKAEAPRSKNARSYSTIAMLGIMALFLPVGGIVWWDASKKRINTPSEVTQNLQMNVLGAIPLVPRNALSGRAGNSKKQLYWSSLLEESIGGIVANLFRRNGRHPRNVVMVSSALAGEGKTTLAGQLALALANSGCKTILVDFDLRRPALDLAFDVELSPGVTELLCGDVELGEAIQETDNANLDLIAAGDWEHNSLRELTKSRMDEFFHSLRSEYEYVVVDGSPILPVVDARLIGQYVDGVILSVLRDVSRAPKVKSAREILDAFEVPFLGVVVIGASKEDVYRYDPRERAKRMSRVRQLN